MHRRVERWADKQYKKSHLGTALKANPFGGASHAKGIVLEKLYVSSCLVLMWDDLFTGFLMQWH